MNRKFISNAIKLSILTLSLFLSYTVNAGIIEVSQQFNITADDAFDTTLGSNPESVLTETTFEIDGFDSSLGTLYAVEMTYHFEYTLTSAAYAEHVEYGPCGVNCVHNNTIAVSAYNSAYYNITLLADVTTLGNRSRTHYFGLNSHCGGRLPEVSECYHNTKHERHVGRTNDVYLYTGGTPDDLETYFIDQKVAFSASTEALATLLACTANDYCFSQSTPDLYGEVFVKYYYEEPSIGNPPQQAIGVSEPSMPLILLNGLVLVFMSRKLKAS